MALRHSTRFRAVTAFLGVLSFVLAVVAELKKPPYRMPIRGADVVVCRLPPDPTVALGALSALAAACCAGIGAVSVFFPYDGRSIPRKALFDYTPCSTSSSISPCATVAGIGTTTWATATEAMHHVRNVHRNLGYACPTAETGLLGAAAFLNLDASLFWLICVMLVGNVTEDYFDGRDEIGGDGGAGIGEK
ncbi:hypothetical protein CFC21_002995 [Triticum aestivum]|uniref:Uncharacterized protein n=1 Tax=Triticum aestivum TaxID=4565 RepID=A0A3B5Y2T5_WHEAT|nr:hypothetical protein CFC21_002995 [Triticum aestivum]